MQRFPLITTIAILAATALSFSERASQFLQYNRAAISRGQIWRLITCHFTHWSPSHAFWSILAFLILAGICEAQSRLRMGAVVAGSAIAISLAIFLSRPSLEFYRGISGIDSALYALIAVHVLASMPGRIVRIMVVCGLLGFAAKIFYEVRSGQPVFANSAGGLVPLPLAHAIGLVTGIVGGIGIGSSRSFPVARASRPCSMVHEMAVNTNGAVESHLDLTRGFFPILASQMSRHEDCSPPLQ